jgi:hypothetical protein
MSTIDRPTQQGPFNFQFHQVAMFTTDIDGAVGALSDLGFDNWSWDEAVLRGQRLLNNQWQDVVTKARMAFNYDIMPLELEFLEYDSKSEHRHRDRMRLEAVPFISHMSVHVKSVVQTMRRMRSGWDLIPYHLFITEQHTNPAVKDKKRFVECIYDTRANLGYDIKCIERLPWDSDVSVDDMLWKGAEDD